ncbi:MAG: hypothetical protein KatS3mg001_152 [Candidatus Pacearchaeota archaeon]|nr:MAG: hypothetical protein KatS3mg001_152 [Candidatus Pacearchaeota archaeon]
MGRQLIIDFFISKKLTKKDSKKETILNCNLL